MREREVFVSYPILGLRVSGSIFECIQRRSHARVRKLTGKTRHGLAHHRSCRCAQPPAHCTGSRRRTTTPSVRHVDLRSSLNSD